MYIPIVGIKGYIWREINTYLRACLSVPEYSLGILYTEVHNKWKMEN